MGYLLAYNPYNTNLFLKRSGMDPAASAYFTATGITAVTQQQAINTLVKSLKANNIWSKMKAVYPFVTDNRNLLGYTENFGNAYWNKSLINVSDNTTTAPNGTLTADSIIPNTTNNYHVIGANNISTTVNSYTYSIYAKASGYNYISIQFVSDPSYTNYYEGIFNLSNGTVESTSRSLNFTGSRTIESIGNGWYRCIITVNAATVSSIAAMNFGAIPTNDASVPYAGNGTSGVYVWGAQLELGSTATTYQPIATTQQAFISNQFKYNLVNPVDSDAAFRLVFNGGWTHSANGATPNGTNGYANTFLTPSIELVQDSVSFGYYTRDISASPTAEVADMGSSKADLNNGLFFLGRFNGNSLNYSRVSSSFTDTFNVSAIPGLYYVSRIASNQYKTYRNATVLNTSLVNSTGLSPNPMWIGGINYASSFSYGTGQCAFSYIGAGLNDTEAANLYTAIQAFQTALSRQV